MNLNAAALKLMAAKGLTLDDVAEIVAANEQTRDPTATERQRRCRANKKPVSHGVTVTRDTPPNERDNLTPREVSEPSGSSPQAKFVLPSDIPADPFRGFVEMRAKSGKRMTDHAKHLAVLRLRKLRDEDGWPPGDVLNHSTLNGYQGLFPPKDSRNDQRSLQRTRPNLTSLVRAANAACLDPEDHGGAGPALPAIGHG
jgi:hypothetical protein